MGGLGATQSSKQAQSYEFQQQINSKELHLQKLKKQKTQTEAQLNKKAKTEKALKEQIDSLKQQLQAKRESQSLIARAASTFSGTASAATPPPASIVEGCGDNSMANFIYMHESGCNVNAMNAGGCRGIGQACPGSKLPCGADYACQNAWFTQYANDVYGGWSGAYSFWLANHWW